MDNLMFVDYFISAFPHVVEESLETIDAQVDVIGVTKVKNEFYCLDKYSKILKIFDDRHPFVLLRNFQLNEVKEACDIVSNEKESALYILDIPWNFRVCVWKIRGSKQNSKANQGEIKWLELTDDFQPFRMSVSKSGQLLMANKELSSILRVYGPDAKLHLSISLHPRIEFPIHVVETSTGNFVILHSLEKDRMISTLSRDGKTIVHTYQPENEEQPLTPLPGCYLSIDSNNRVFVADFYNNRVILLDSNL